jgi:hypothetical protein
VPDREHLLQAFDRGALVRPTPAHMGYVDVVRAVAHASGVEVPLNEHSRDLAAHLRGVDHLIFLLADGLGIDLIDRTPRNSWLRRHTLRSIIAPFPSTTTTAVTSLLTGEHPAQHSVIGWWVHLPEIASPATVFTHDRAVDGRSLDDLEVDVATICPTAPMLPRMTRTATFVAPEAIVDSPYTRYMAGTCQRVGYRGHEEAVSAILRTIMESDGPTFTYWYTSSPDSEAHEEGVNSDRVFRSMDRLDQAAERLAKSLDELAGTWRIVGTADHGHLDLDPHLEVARDDILLDYLECPPAGDMRVQFWHVQPGQEEAFCSGFRQRFGRWFYLLTAEEFEELALLGPDAWSEDTRTRVGTHVSISRGRAALRFAGIPGSAGYLRMQSGHSGLSPAEMRIPLIIAGEETRPADYGC